MTAVEIVASRNTDDIQAVRAQQGEDVKAIRNDIQLVHDRFSAANQREADQFQALQREIRDLQVVVAGEAARTMRILVTAVVTASGVTSTLVVVIQWLLMT